MTTIGPGTPLICISNIGNSEGEDGQVPREFNLTVGALYHCATVKDGAGFGRCKICGVDCDCITLKEKPGGFSVWCYGCRATHHFESVAYCITLFRPLNDGDTSLVEQEKEIEDEAPPLQPVRSVPA